MVNQLEENGFDFEDSDADSEESLSSEESSDDEVGGRLKQISANK